MSTNNIVRLETAIKHAISTEKAHRLVAQKVLTFVVAKDVNKVELLQAFTKLGLEVVSINLLNVKGKTKNRGQRKGRRKDYKKAYVRVASLPTAQEAEVAAE